MGEQGRPTRPTRPTTSPQSQNPFAGQTSGKQGYPQQNMQGYPQQNMQSYPQQNMQGYPQPNMMEGQGYPQMAVKNKKSGKKVLIIVLCVILGLGLLGTLAYFVGTARWDARVNDKNTEISKLKDAVNEMTVKEVIPTNSLQRVKGQYVQELWLIDGDFVAPNPLDVPNTKDSVNDSFVQIGQKFAFRPSDRWMLMSQGATYEFSHPQKIWGKIRALSRTNTDKVTDEDMRNIVQQFFLTDEAKYPNLSEITYRRAYIDDYQVGVIGKAQFTVYYTDNEDLNNQIKEGVGSVLDPNAEGIEKPEGADIQSKDMIINVGFVTKGEYALSIIFIYDADGGGNSQELVDLLLKSATLGPNGSALKLE